VVGLQADLHADAAVPDVAAAGPGIGDDAVGDALGRFIEGAGDRAHAQGRAKLVGAHVEAGDHLKASVVGQVAADALAEHAVLGVQVHEVQQ
ncbi:hypothetical protein COW49_01300, partial [Candidatus Kaiserbacteria bacterium CG17_big_fil_post_rev_8_21_14_2_50_51_7]